MKPIKKIAIIGPESTGKSTLARQLASHYNTIWVPEFARRYIDQLNRPYRQSDLLAIAKGQLASEQEAEPLARQYLFCDTNLLALKIWSEDKFGSCDPWITDNLLLDTYALHLLTYPDLAWEPDSQREDPHRLEELFHLYEQELNAAGLNYFIVKGTGKVRLENSIVAVNGMES